jgi:hypothetical protein
VRKKEKRSTEFLQSKRANIAVDPLLTNPLNSDTKLQIRVRLQNIFFEKGGRKRKKQEIGRAESN